MTSQGWPIEYPTVNICNYFFLLCFIAMHAHHLEAQLRWDPHRSTASTQDRAAPQLLSVTTTAMREWDIHPSHSVHRVHVSVTAMGAVGAPHYSIPRGRCGRTDLCVLAVCWHQGHNQLGFSPRSTTRVWCSHGTPKGFHQGRNPAEHTRDLEPRGYPMDLHQHHGAVADPRAFRTVQTRPCVGIG